MSKKFFVSLTIILFAIFSFTVCLAANNETGLGNAVNGVRNFVGGVENTMENAAGDVSNTTKNVTGGIENRMTGNDNANTRTNNGYNTSGTADDDYTTTRVNTGDATVMGMTSTGWTWLILGIAAIGIIAIVWYYSMQFKNTTNSNTHND